MKFTSLFSGLTLLAIATTTQAVVINSQLNSTASGTAVYLCQGVTTAAGTDSWNNIRYG